MPLSTNDLRNGMTIDLPEGLFSVVEFQHVKPGKGGAFVRTKLRNLRTKAVVERTFRADEKVEQAVIDKREMQYLYRDGEQYVFMDNVSYEQLYVDTSALGDAPSYLKEGDSVVLQMYGGEIVDVDLPASVELHHHRDRAGDSRRSSLWCSQARDPRDRARSSRSRCS